MSYRDEIRLLQDQRLKLMLSDDPGLTIKDRMKKCDRLTVQIEDLRRKELATSVPVLSSRAKSEFVEVHVPRRAQPFRRRSKVKWFWHTSIPFDEGSLVELALGFETLLAALPDDLFRGVCKSIRQVAIAPLHKITASCGVLGKYDFRMFRLIIGLDYDWVETLAHEIGHTVARLLWGDGVEREEWMEEILWARLPPISGCASSPEENFAEAFAYYLTGRPSIPLASRFVTAVLAPGKRARHFALLGWKMDALICKLPSYTGGWSWDQNKWGWVCGATNPLRHG